MPQSSAAAGRSIADTESKLAHLDVQVEAVQALLIRLLQDVVRAESRLEGIDAARLVEVNEQLVVSAMDSQAELDASAQALKVALDSTSTDPLTNLPNRAALLDRFLQAAATAKRHKTQFALLFVDLDDFKRVNDALGHSFGDKVLHHAAQRMLSVVREVDTVSRHGGDEFLVLLPDLARPDDARTVAGKLGAAVATPTTVDGHEVTVTASIGIAFYPDHGQDFETLVARADAAMYDTKRQRAGGIRVHGSDETAMSTSTQAAPPTVPSPPAGAHGAMESARLHARLREANEKLVLAVVTAQELQAAAELAHRRQTAFMTKVAEELLNPVAPIRIASAMLGHDPAEQPLTPLLPLVQGIVDKQITHVSRLVESLVEASTVERGVLALDRQRIDLCEAIEAAILSHRPMMDERAQRFECRLPPGTLPVDGDAARLEQIISNLLDNASQHTHYGGRIRLVVTTTVDTLTLVVSDDGLGVTPQMLPYVFEPFVQDTHVLSFNGLGLGIGLTVSRALARAHGGNLVAFSAGANRGSEFVMTLPLSVDVAVDSSTDAGKVGSQHSDRSL
jgi:diguanylate cyclase (GGDEF)-like protein